MLVVIFLCEFRIESSDLPTFAPSSPGQFVGSRYVYNIVGNGIGGYNVSNEGRPATSANLNLPHGLFVDHDLNIYLADRGNNCIRRVNTDGNIFSFAGVCSSEGGGLNGDSSSVPGITPTNVLFNAPYHAMADTLGNMFISDSSNSLIRFIPKSDR